VTGIIPGITKSLNESGDFDGVIPIVRKGSFESSQGDKILEVRVVTAASLVGNKYKTIKVDDYKNYYKELAFKKVKMPGGAEIDFDDVRTFKDIEADELKSYVEYEKSYLEGEMERTFREDFADYSKTELNDRISKELNDATGKYIAGEAMKDAPGHRKSIVPGAPDITTVTRVAATIGASCVPGVGPLLALAVQGAFTALDKHDGYIASWRQAGVQFGIAAATTYLTAGMGSGIGSTITRTAINTATSGIDYKSNGSIGWSNDKFRAGIKSSAVNGAISYGLEAFNVGGGGRLGAGLKAGITSFANSTLDFNEDGWKIGIRNDNNWGDRFASGIAAGAASAATFRSAGKDESDKTNNPGTGKTEFAGGITTDEYLGHLAYNTINSGLLSVYNMKRYDMSWSQASTTTGFYSGMNYSVSELGGFAGSALAELTGRADIGRQKDEEARKKAEAEAAKNKSGQNGPPVSAAEGFVNALGAGLIRIKNDLKDLWDGLKGIGESVGNLVGGKGFNTDAELTEQSKQLVEEYLKIKDMTLLAGVGDANMASAAEAAARKAEILDELRGKDPAAWEILQDVNAKNRTDDTIYGPMIGNGKYKSEGSIPFISDVMPYGEVYLSAIKTAFEGLLGNDKLGNSLANSFLSTLSCGEDGKLKSGMSAELNENLKDYLIKAVIKDSDLIDEMKGFGKYAWKEAKGGELKDIGEFIAGGALAEFASYLAMKQVGTLINVKLGDMGKIKGGVVFEKRFEKDVNNAYVEGNIKDTVTYKVTKGFGENESSVTVGVEKDKVMVGFEGSKEEKKANVKYIDEDFSVGAASAKYKTESGEKVRTGELNGSVIVNEWTVGASVKKKFYQKESNVVDWSIFVENNNGGNTIKAKVYRETNDNNKKKETKGEVYFQIKY